MKDFLVTAKLHGADLETRRGPIAPVWLEPMVPGWVIVDYTTLIEGSRDPGTWSHDSRLWIEWGRTFQS